MAFGTLGESAVIDHIDRRRLLVLTQAGFGLTSFVLCRGSLSGDPPIVLLGGQCSCSRA